MAAGYGMAIQAIAGGINGFLGGRENNAKRSQILDAYSNLPQVPDLQDEFLNGYMKQLEFTPQALDFEQSLRRKYLPQDTQQALDLYRQYGPQFAKTSSRILDRIDPTFNAGHRQLFGVLSDDLAHGSELTPDMAGQLDANIRAAQAARGNVLGAAPVTNEAYSLGSAGEALKQTRIGNMERFLTGPTTADKTGGLMGPGGAALGMSMGTAVNPGYSYIEGPHNWGPTFENASQTQWQDSEGQALARAQAIAGAPVEQNPWLASLQGGLGAISGGMGGGGGGGGMGSLFGGGGSTGFSSPSGTNVSSAPATMDAYNGMF